MCVCGGICVFGFDYVLAIFDVVDRLWDGVAGEIVFMDFDTESILHCCFWDAESCSMWRPFGLSVALYISAPCAGNFSSGIWLECYLS